MKVAVVYLEFLGPFLLCKKPRQQLKKTFTDKKTKTDEVTQIFTCDFKSKCAAGHLCVIIASESIFSANRTAIFWPATSRDDCSISAQHMLTKGWVNSPLLHLRQHKYTTGILRNYYRPENVHERMINMSWMKKIYRSLWDKLLLKWSYNLTHIIIPFTALMIGSAAVSTSDMSLLSSPFTLCSTFLPHIVAAILGTCRVKAVKQITIGGGSVQKQMGSTQNIKEKK